MAGFEAFDRQLVLATDSISPANVGKALAKFARQELAKAIAGGASPEYDTYVNGRKDAPLESVVPPGPIVFEFINWGLIIKTALDELIKRSPRRSGRYVSSFVVLANQRPVTDYRSIDAEAEVIIFNARPYTRRIEVGANKSSGKRHFDQSKSALSRRFREAFTFETRFLDIRAGVHPLVPYVLKGSQGRRKDRQAGMPISYPAIVINAL